jgi:hypothetical protein
MADIGLVIHAVALLRQQLLDWQESSEDARQLVGRLDRIRSVLDEFNGLIPYLPHYVGDQLRYCQDVAENASETLREHKERSRLGRFVYAKGFRASIQTINGALTQAEDDFGLSLLVAIWRAGLSRWSIWAPGPLFLVLLLLLFLACLSPSPLESTSPWISTVLSPSNSKWWNSILPCSIATQFANITKDLHDGLGFRFF